MSLADARPCPQGGYDVTTLCHDGELADGTPAVEVAPADLYPAMVERIAAAIDADERVPKELVDIELHPDIHPARRAKDLFAAAAELPAEAWKLALVPCGKLTDPHQVNLRMQALEIARQWFTRALKNRLSPLALRILRDDDYRL